MELLTLEITPSGPFGWGSGQLEFGKGITQLYAKTGSGKTPVISAVSYALGYHHEFRNDIVEKCHSARLEVGLLGSRFLFERLLSDTFKIYVYEEMDGAYYLNQLFDNEKDFSGFLFEKIGYKMPVLSTTQSKQASVYINTFFPLFVLNQLSGYNDLYKPLKGSFIKDQSSEMMRIALGISAKNPFGKNKILKIYQTRSEAINERLVSLRGVQAQLSTKEIELANVDELMQEEEDLKTRIETLRSQDKDEDFGLKNLRVAINRKSEVLSGLVRESRKINSRKLSNERIREEISGEIFTLSLNEEAASAFRKSMDICQNNNCGIFAEETKGYGKELLYLKDQIKNMESTYKLLSEEGEDISFEISRLEVDIKRDKELLSDVTEKKGIDQIAALAKELSSRLVDINLLKGRREKYDEISESIIKLESERNEVLDSISDLKPSGGEKNILLEKRRRQLEGYIDRWLEIIGTRNTYGSASVDKDFKLLIGEEKLSQFGGATLTRMVLAFHAALIELILVEKLPFPGFLILDTPKQHELENEDFDKYIKELKVLSATYKHVQFIFSATSYLYDGDDKDKCWRPGFAIGADNMYLGQVRVD
ncbi:Uncharacterised protein [Zhongshania aliphaticivorans]|jgi:hypothetical protein|uniref:Rad50/SbcC-type AAA domain-containing protein n=1 Tax=Zhongshania aliphaticivorans TaxID=1470434 RepID=A0A5S9PR39_9GAMM|nr:hypothetical protein [Zhongshania aliphaticivorans]CAA0107140.1 Uncharacterised protein [Zhongshania aliphaticivorans]CAA0107247.1 Uncharacterised protein [Zhongshania aliphaticivorans]